LWLENAQTAKMPKVVQLRSFGKKTAQKAEISQMKNMFLMHVFTINNQ